MKPPSFAIETKDLHYYFRKNVAVVNNVSLQVPAGSIFGFLGPNGAGKTTTMRLLCGLLSNDADNIFINGKSLQKNMPHIFGEIGALIETPSIYPHLSGYNNLKVLTQMRGLSASVIDETLDIVGLRNAASRKAKEYSLGMKQRLGIAMALLSKPSLLLLDEPVNGLDPNGMIEMRELLIKLNKEKGITIFISSHLLNEIEKMCTHIAFIHKGSLRFQGTMQELQAAAIGKKQVHVKINDAEQYFSAISEMFPGVKLLEHQYVQFDVDGEEEIISINQQLVKNEIPVASIEQRTSLEKWFMQQMKS